jgi:hypothetical protein
MTKKNKIESLIKEDMVNYNSSSKGYDWQNTTTSMQMSLVDILKMDRTDNDQAQKVLPHEVQTSFEKVLNIVDSVDELKSDFIRAYNNPVIADDSAKKQSIKDMIRDLGDANKKYVEVIKKLDKLRV